MTSGTSGIKGLSSPIKSDLQGWYIPEPVYEEPEAFITRREGRYHEILYFLPILRYAIASNVYAK